MPKMLDKFLLFLYSIVIGVVSVYSAFVGLGWVSEATANQWLNQVYQTKSVSDTMAAAGIILLLISIRFFIVSVRKSKGRQPSIDQRTEFGDVSISMDTIENLALKAAARIRGAKDYKARVKVTDAGLEIVVRTFIDGDYPIPALSEEMQANIKDHVETTTGVPVASVSVYIANIHQTAHTFKSRVE